MIGDILFAYLLQIAFTVGIIFFFGWLIALLNKRFYANFGSYGRIACYATGFIGTPIHELSHALFCLIFGHKIVKIKLFQINSADGTLGFVSHTYNKKNIYQRIGNFFIGVAPILVISAILYLLAYLLMPSFTEQIGSLSSSISSINSGKIFECLRDIFRAFFLSATTWQWWLFILTGLFLSLHMTLSGADVKGALSGLIVLLVGVFVADIILALINDSLLVSFTREIISAGSWLLCILVVSLIISIVSVGISYLAKAALRKKMGKI